MVGVNGKHQGRAIFWGSPLANFLLIHTKEDPTQPPSFFFPTRMAHYPFPKTLVYGADHGAVCGVHYCTLCGKSLIIVVMKTPAL